MAAGLPGRNRRRWLVPTVIPTVLALAVAVPLLLANFDAAPAPAPHARSYLNVTACLLTGPRGVTPGSTAAPVWASMQAASLTTHVMVSYLSDTGPADVPVMLNTLIQRQCGVIIAADADPGQVIQAARANPRQRFLLVAGSGGSGIADVRAPANAVAVPAARASAQISQAIHALAAAA
ncbi:MAG: hypothetical protein JO345_24305 [Streptosporangiaceae bacterium]|nr:hypothetical protein [Streptosporangiaceae bacterium]